MIVVGLLAISIAILAYAIISIDSWEPWDDDDDGFA